MTPRDFDNVIPFPADNPRAGFHALDNPFSASVQKNEFRIGDRVRLKNSGKTGWVTDGRPDFGVSKKWIYWVMRRDGVMVPAAAENMELIGRVE